VETLLRRVYRVFKVLARADQRRAA
jgi:hypothetical protein